MGKWGRAVWLGMAGLALAAIGFIAGLIVAMPPPSVAPGSELIAESQKASIYGQRPNWMEISGDEPLFKEVRNRAYSFCYRDELIDHACATEQDEAIRDAISALDVAAAQRRMPDKSRLGLKEGWVAEHPEIVTRIRSYCWNLYKAHGESDARLLAICLGNLTDFSPLVPLPVP